MAREIKKILISTMPRSGTVFLFNFIVELFEFKKVEPLFTGGAWPQPPEWDPYKFDETYLSLKDGEVLCAHYPINEKIKQLIDQDDVLVLYLYRDPRDVTVSAVMYIKYALTQHPLHSLFAGMSDTEAIAFILSGGVFTVGDEEERRDYLIHEGIKYFCDIATDWLNDKRVAAIRYEDLMRDPVATLEASLRSVDVSVDRDFIQSVAGRLTFEGFSGNRPRGVEHKSSHFRKGIVGDWKNHFTDFHKAICKLRIGDHLIKLGYEADLLW